MQTEIQVKFKEIDNGLDILKKHFNCNGTQQNKQNKQNKQTILILNWDHRLALKKYLIDNNIINSNNIIVHGFN